MIDILTNGVQWKTERLKSLLYIIFLYHSLSFLNLAVSIYFWVSQNLSDFCICLFLCVPSSLIFSMYGWYRTHLLVTCLRSFEMHCDNFMWSLTHWGRDKMDAISQTTFSRAFSWMKIFDSPKFVPKGSINNIPALVQIMAWRRPGDKPLSEPMMLNLSTHMCVTRPQWVKGMVFII